MPHASYQSNVQGSNSLQRAGQAALLVVLLLLTSKYCTRPPPHRPAPRCMAWLTTSTCGRVLQQHVGGTWQLLDAVATPHTRCVFAWGLQRCRGEDRLLLQRNAAGNTMPNHPLALPVACAN